jgi:hypothetical protein
LTEEKEIKEKWERRVMMVIPEELVTKVYKVTKDLRGRKERVRDSIGNSVSGREKMEKIVG